MASYDGAPANRLTATLRFQDFHGSRGQCMVVGVMLFPTLVYCEKCNRE